MNEWIQLITAGIGAFGFSLLFNIRGKSLVGASLGGFLVWGVYLILYHNLENPFISAFIASLLITIYAECMARFYKTPVTIFLVSSLIPLIPGSNLYYAVSSAMIQDWENFQQEGSQVLLFSIGIAGGVICATVIFQMLHQIKQRAFS